MTVDLWTPDNCDSVYRHIISLFFCLVVSNLLGITMSEDDIGPSVSASPGGLVTQSPLSFALVLVGLYWIVKVLRPSDASRPPGAPYWIPWLGSALEMGKDPDGFFSNMTYVSSFPLVSSTPNVYNRRLLGPVFRVKALGQEMVYVTSPAVRGGLSCPLAGCS